MPATKVSISLEPDLLTSIDQAQEATEQERQKETQASSGHRTYYLHKSNPDIKLIDTVKENGKTYYLDTKGRSWLMNADMTLTGVARIVV